MSIGEFGTWQERVIWEQKELARKIVKLTTFVTDYTMTKDLLEEDYYNLRKQFDAMLEYNRILQRRINCFREN